MAALGAWIRRIKGAVLGTGLTRAIKRNEEAAARLDAAVKEVLGR